MSAKDFTKEERLKRAVLTLAGKDGKALHDEMEFLKRIGVEEEEIWEALDTLKSGETIVFGGPFTPMDPEQAAGRMKRAKPKFEHDCDACIFLGGDEEHDFYFCPRCESDMGGTCIARFGSEGSKYQSMPTSIVQRTAKEGWGTMDGKHVPGSDPSVENYPTVKALKLAVEKGLVK